MRPRLATLGGLLALTSAALAPTARANGPIGDAPAFARIEALRPVAAAIAIDGNGADWGAIPVLPDPPGDAGGDGSRDITGVAIAPLADALLVRIETVAAPSTEDLAFWLDIDFVGQEPLDIEIGLYAVFPDILWTYPEAAPPFFQEWPEAGDPTTAIASVLEVRIPYAELAALLPPAMAAALTGPGARPFVRVTPFSVQSEPPFGLVDYGPAAASFRLVPTPYVLDSTLPAGADAAVVVPQPLDGLWYVGQGPFGLGTHAGYWGYDFSIVDNTLHPDVPYLSPNLGDYMSFAEPVRAPVAGTVISTVDGNDDIAPRSGGPGAANFVWMDIGGDVALLFTHLKKSSVAVVPTQSVAAGAVIGQVGNSGSGAWPHLHLGASLLPSGETTVPLAFKDVEVGLNPVANDPWLRWLPAWGIREGYLTRPAGALCGDVVVDELLNASDVSAFRALLANPAGAALSLEGARRCTVVGPPRSCDVRDVAILRRELASPSQPPGISQVCPAALGT